MNLRSISRRRLLRQAALVSGAGALASAAAPPMLGADEPPRMSAPRSDGVNVRDHGAAGDGKQDDTPAFEAALKAAARTAGNVVRVPRGNYLIRGTLNGCHFIGWGQKDREAPCLLAKRGGLTVTGCDFMDRGKVQVALQPDVDAALVFGNRFRGKERILNQAGDRAQIATNVVSG
jgi:hypothetical protein